MAENTKKPAGEQPAAAADQAEPVASCLSLRQKLVEMRKACPEIVKKQHRDGVSYKYDKIYDALKYYLFEKFTVDQGEDDPDNSDFSAQGKGSSGSGGQQQRGQQGQQRQGTGKLSDAQLGRLYKKAEAAGMTKERTDARILEKYKKQDPATLSRQEYDEICASLDAAAAQHNQQGGQQNV